MKSWLVSMTVSVSVKTDYVTAMRICDMIKGNESDVANIDFELQAKRGDKFSCFTLFKIQKDLLISQEPAFGL